MIKTFEDMIELMHTYWGGDKDFHKDLDRLLELHNAELKKWEEEHTDALYRAEMKGRADGIGEFVHSLKETFNNEFPSNYHCTRPYFTLDNVRMLVDAVAKEFKEKNNAD